MATIILGDTEPIFDASRTSAASAVQNSNPRDVEWSAQKAITASVAIRHSKSGDDYRNYYERSYQEATTPNA